MTREEKTMICKVLRRETACGMMDASRAIDELIKALKMKASHCIMDAPNNIKITWEYYDKRRSNKTHQSVES